MERWAAVTFPIHQHGKRRWISGWCCGDLGMERDQPYMRPLSWHLWSIRDSIELFTLYASREQAFEIVDRIFSLTDWRTARGLRREVAMLRFTLLYFRLRLRGLIS